MAFKKFKARKSYVGVRRRRKFRGRPMMGLLRNVYTKYNIHKYKRTCDFDDLGTYDSKSSLGASIAYDSYVTVTTANVTGQVDYNTLAVAFGLADLPGYTEFTNLYDAYQLNYVKVKLYPMFSNSLAPTGNSNMNPGILLHYCVDRDDATAPTASAIGIQDLRQYDNYRLVNNVMGLKCFKIGIKPKVSMQIYNTAISTAYAENVGKPIFIDCTNPSVPHFGLKMIFETWNASNTTCNWKFRVSNTYYFTMKDVR